MKKSILFKATHFTMVLVICLIMGGASVFAQENDVGHAEPGQRGDINGDGKITAVDYMLLKRHILRTYALTADQLNRADINTDGKISAPDYMLLKRHVLGTYVIPSAKPEEHIHEWKEANCTTPKTCVTCGETEGSAKGHNWKAATCTVAKTCLTCRETEGEANGHDYGEATCTKPKACKICGRTTGSSNGHDYADATCKTPKTCKVCGKTRGTPTGHDWETATCTEPRACRFCGETEGEANGHAWVRECMKPMTCEVCGETLGDVQAHEYEAATCMHPMTCERCGKVEGSALGHDYKDGKCTRCRGKDPTAGRDENVVYGDSPVVVFIDGKVYSFASFDEVSAVIPFKTAEKGYAFTMKATGTTLTSNGDGSWHSGDGDIWSANLVTNLFKNKWCRICGKRAGNGTHGTCVKYLQPTNCYRCGQPVGGVVCHTCHEE